MYRFALLALAGLASGCSSGFDRIGPPDTLGVFMKLGPRTELDEVSAFIRMRLDSEIRQLRALPASWDTASVRLEHPSILRSARTSTLVKNTDLLPDVNGGYRAAGALGGALRPVSGYTLTASLWNGGVGGALVGEKRRSLTLASGVNAVSLPIEVYPAPGIAGFLPTSGIPGDPVVLSGQGFSVVPSYNQVRLGAAAAAFTVHSSESITATIPDLGPSLYTWQVRVGSQAGNRSGFTVLGTIGSTLPWVSLGSSQADPDIAWGQGEAMIVWNDDRVTNKTDIYAKRIGADGTAIGTDFPVSNSNSWLRKPCIAFSPAANRFLVAWEDSSGSGDIRAQLLARDGTAIGANFDLATGVTAQKNPQIGFNAYSGKYLVSWTQAGDVYAQVVSADGSIEGAAVQVFTGSGVQDQSSVAARPGADGFLVLWQDSAPTKARVRGRFVSSSGIPTDGPFDIGYDAAYDQVQPYAAPEETTGDYYVVWVSNTTPQSIMGQWVTAAGVLVGGPITLSNASGNKTYPRVAFESWRQKFVVTWNDNRFATTDVFGQYVSIDGALWGTNFAVKSAPGDQTPSEVVVDSVGKRGLVVYQDSSSGGDIYGQFIR